MSENANGPARGIVRGVALNPGTPLAVLEPLLDELDLVHLLAINPGWGGQKFLPATMGRIAEGRRLLERAGRRILLGVDGGITREHGGTTARGRAEPGGMGQSRCDREEPDV